MEKTQTYYGTSVQSYHIRNIWETTARVYADMLEQEGWVHIDETASADFNKITHKVRIAVLGGFEINYNIGLLLQLACLVLDRDCWLRYTNVLS